MKSGLLSKLQSGLWPVVKSGLLFKLQSGLQSGKLNRILSSKPPEVELLESIWKLGEDMTYIRRAMAAFAGACLIAPACVGGALAQVQPASITSETGVPALAAQLQQAVNQSIAISGQQKLDFDAAQSLTLEALQAAIIASGLSPLEVQKALVPVRATTRPSNAALDALKTRVDATVVACYTQAQVEAARKGKGEIQRGSCAAGLSVAATGGDPAALSPAPSFGGVSGGADYRSGS